MNEQAVMQIVNDVIAELLPKKQAAPTLNEIPIGISARHIHLQQEHVEQLFGKGASLSVKKMLAQPGQFAAHETLQVVGPKGSIQNVRVLGPARNFTQIEISHTDAIALGIQPPLRESGEIAGSASCILVGPRGSLILQEGVIIAQAHIHMAPADAQRLGVQNGQYVSVRVQGRRPIIFEQVKIRVADHYQLEMHIDTDEANAGFIQQGETGTIITGNMAGEPFNNLDSPPIEINHRFITANDVSRYQGETVIVPKEARLTALAKEAVEKLEIDLQFHEKG
ncbi:phosphate propanoyltransferase [Lysinibacillus boronitolerans]|uniref:phosphate propanoyltransferase n=1 Tax=Lysinibacillus boronitolerans TaxID=309788 RepID=UPI0021637A9F|nr:phosphate propanoyltransferase [Lysinibacillus boronitolerans]MCS1390956.1 phosphate propanoyltransferase [Lysinibacillus boronitolerans]